MVEIFDHNCPLYEFDPSLQRTTEAGSGWLLQWCAAGPLQFILGRW